MQLFESFFSYFPTAQGEEIKLFNVNYLQITIGKKVWKLNNQQIWKIHFTCVCHIKENKLYIEGYFNDSINYFIIKINM